MRIVDIREAMVLISSPIQNAYIDFSKMTASVVAVVTDVMRDGRPTTGYGSNSNGRYAASGLLNERFLPRLREADPENLLTEAGDNLDARRIWAAMMSNEKPGGHGERSVAVGVVDMAVWDAAAKIADMPLWHYLADTEGDGSADGSVFVYAADGYYYPGKDDAQLQEEMRRYRGMGYEVVKMKIGGASLDEDRRRIEAVLEVVGEGRYLAVDANGRFDIDTAIAYGDPLDYALQAELARHYDGPMATGENLFSHQDARNLLGYGGMRPDRDWLQFNCALSYGLVEYLRTLALLPDYGFTNRNVVPHGGHQLSLNIAAGLKLDGNESYPDVFAPFGGFADNTMVENGRIGLPDAPGIGFESKQALIACLREATGT